MSRIDWHQRYLDEIGVVEGALAKAANAVFTVYSFIGHAVVYPLLMYLEGGDYHLFLDAISIEAVFVSMCVGIQTKLSAKRDRVAQLQRDSMQASIEHLVETNTDLTEAIHERVVGRGAGPTGGLP